MSRKYICFIAALMFAAPLSAQTCKRDLDSYAGRYTGSSPSGFPVVYVTVRFGELNIRPIDWSGGSPYQPVATDSFSMTESSRFAVAFGRDAHGCVVEMRTVGYGFNEPLKRRSGPTLPAEELWTGNAQAGIRRLMGLNLSNEQLLEIASRLGRMPTKNDRLISLYEALIKKQPLLYEAHTGLGNALVLAGRRAEARAHFQIALSQPETRDDAAVALRMLDGKVPPNAQGGWQVPFRLEDVFTAARPEEIRAVRADWAKRDLQPRDVKHVRDTTLSLRHARVTMRVFSHLVHGQKHYGIVLIPEGARPGRTPIVIEARGVSPSFPPLRASSLTAPEMMGADIAKVIIAAPSYRGEGLIVGTDTLMSEGDRSNAWDGATDDLLAFLNVVKQVTPEADSTRVCVFGRSRGGSVALLSGIRDASIDCTVAWAAPTEWTRLMHIGGWTTLETVREGLAVRSKPGQLGGQAIDYFLSPAIAGKADLAATRLRLFASSPLYFADRIGLTQAHWGNEDPVVHAQNGREFEGRARRSGVPKQCLETFYHDGGHDMDRQIAPRESRRFIMAALFGNPAKCR